jgi:prepilin-type N-terminal cleavage/methylation domain-containing protein
MERNGFTIIEMVMVFILAGILAVITIVTFTNPLRGMQLSNASEKIASDLRFASSLAQAHAGWYGISFETAPLSRYSVYTTTGTIDTIIENPNKVGDLFITNIGTDFSVSIAAVTFESGKKVEFSPLGVPYDDRTGSAITNEGVVLLTRAGASRTVRITPETGRIYIQ